MLNKDYRWIVLFALSLIIFLINVDYTAVNLALIPMASDLHADLNTIQWVLNGYILTWAVLVIPFGNYTDRHQKKNVCLGGLGLFALSSLLAGLANSSELLIAARILQGIAGAIFVPAIYSLIYINFAENERGRAIGILSLGVGLGMAIGPFIGGVLISLFSWRSIFYINIPISLIAAFIIYFNKQEEKLLQSNKSLNTISSTLLGGSIIIILCTLNQWNNWSNNLMLYSGLIAIAIIGLISFIQLQKKLAQPLIPLKLFTNLAFSAVIIGILVEQYGFSTIIVGGGLFLQKVLQLSSLMSSIIYLALTIIFGIIAAISGPWIDRLGLRIPTALGLFILSLGSFLFALLSPVSNMIFVCGVFTIIGIGMGLAFAALNAGIVKTVTPEFIGIASSIFMTIALLGNSFGVTLTTLIYQKTGLSQLLHFLNTSSITVETSQIRQLANFIANIGGKTYDLNLFNPETQTYLTQYAPFALNIGISKLMLFTGTLLLLAAIICAKLLNTKLSIDSSYDNDPIPEKI